MGRMDGNVSVRNLFINIKRYTIENIIIMLYKM